LARAGRVEDRLERATRQGRRPEGRAGFSPQDRLRRRGRDLELGIAAEPFGVYLEWAGKRVVVGLDRRNMLLIALARIGEAAADSPRASGPPRARYNVIVQ
jgi:hypothetical protein